MVRVLSILLIAVSCLGQSFTFRDQTFLGQFLAPASPTNFTADLYMWWKMDEGTGTDVDDSSGNGIDGAFLAKAPNPSWVTGKSGPYALQMSTTSQTGVSSSANLNFATLCPNGHAFTWWQYNTIAYNSGTIRSYWGYQRFTANDWGCHFFIWDNNNLIIGWANTSQDNRITVAATAAWFPQNTWTFYAFIQRRGTIKWAQFCVNGNIVAANTAPSTDLVSDLNLPMLVGTTGYDLPGGAAYIDDFRFYTNAISTNDVYYLYHSVYGQP